MGAGNSLGQHECAIEDCHIQVSASRLMCAYHWFKVPAELRREVTGSWTIWRKFHGDHALEKYEHVRGLAIEAVEDLRRRSAP